MKPKSIPNPNPNPNVQDVAKPTWAHPNVRDVAKPTWAHPNVRDVAKPIWPRTLTFGMWQSRPGRTLTSWTWQSLPGHRPCMAAKPTEECKTESAGRIVKKYLHPAAGRIDTGYYEACAVQLFSAVWCVKIAQPIDSMQLQ